MYSVEGGLSPAEIEEQARTEWISRGFPVDEFTVKGMQQVWKQEENVKKNADENQANKLAEKMAAIQRAKDRALLPSKKELTAALQDAWSSAKVNAKASAARLARSLELPFMKRARLQREHLERVLQQHSAADVLHSKKEEARRTRRLERIHELARDKKNKILVTEGAPFREHLKNLEDTSANKRKLLDKQAKKEKRQAYIDGIHEGQRKRAQKAASLRAAALRRLRAKADREFERKAKLTQHEYVERKAMLEKVKNEKSIKKQEDFIQEQIQYKKDLYTEEMSFPSLSAGSAGGVFGTPVEPESFARGGHIVGQDEYTVTGGAILTQGAPTGTAFEERQGLLFEMQAEQGRLQEKYDDLRRKQLDCEDETSTLLERIRKAEQDITQSDYEQREFEDELDGVGRKHAGRRFAYRHERKTVHQRKERREGLINLRNSLKRRVKMLEKEVSKISKEELCVARDLAVMRAEVSKAEESQAREYSERPQLPMIIGRQLNQVKGIRDQISASRDTIRETLIGSKFEILKNESKEAARRAKAMHKMNHQEWKSIIRHRDLKVEVELGESQLHNVVGRLKEVMKKQQSSDLQGAVQKWWQNQAEAVANYKVQHPEDDEVQIGGGGGLQGQEESLRDKALSLGGLRKVNVVHQGWIDWWSLRDVSQTAGIEQFNVENVQLGQATFGVIQGRIIFPKHGLYMLEFVVTKADELAATSGDPNDYVAVRLGTSAMSLALVGKYYNVRAPGEPGVRYSIKKQVTGQRISFRFEMASSSEKQETHMMVTRGRFKHMKPPPLEQIGDDPNHVLSSYVKMQRIEEKQGKARGAILLGELIKVENLEENDGLEMEVIEGDGELMSPITSPSKKKALTHTWFDTKVVNGFNQRFDRRHLAQFLRDELKREMNVSRRANEKNKRAADAIREQRDAGEGGSNVADQNKAKMAEEQKLERERDRAARMEKKERKKKGHSVKKNQESSTDSLVKKWPRFGTKEDGHDEEELSEDEKKTKAMEIVGQLKDERELNNNSGGGDGPSQSDAPPDLFAAGLDDEGGSTPFNTDVLRRPAERELLLQMKKMRRKREMPPKKLTEDEKKVKEALLQEKLDRSKRAYLLRKRCGVEVDMEQARELVGQRLEIYFVQEARWRLGTVIDMRAEWQDGGKQLGVMHAVKYYGAEGSPTIWENMSQRRFVVLKSDLASVEARRLAIEEKRRLRNETLRRQKEEFERNERLRLEDQERIRREEAEEMRKEMRADIAEAIEVARKEAVFVAETPAMNRFFEDQVPKITEEQKQGIGTEDGYGIFVVPKVAKSIAKRRFIDGKFYILYFLIVTCIFFS
jgi:hypothetical protein